MILAKIWQLSDIDNDGKLTQEEFMLALHLSDMAKSGQINLRTVLSPLLWHAVVMHYLFFPSQVLSSQ